MKAVESWLSAIRTAIYRDYTLLALPSVNPLVPIRLPFVAQKIVDAAVIWYNQFLNEYQDISSQVTLSQTGSGRVML